MRCVKAEMFTSRIDLTLFQSLDSNAPSIPQPGVVDEKVNFHVLRRKPIYKGHPLVFPSEIRTIDMHSQIAVKGLEFLP